MLAFANHQFTVAAVSAGADYVADSDRLIAWLCYRH